jgi:hypothetical protein
LDAHGSACSDGSTALKYAIDYVAPKLEAYLRSIGAPDK